MKLLYNKLKHNHVEDIDIVTETFIRYAKLKYAECRMKFAKLLIFESS